MEGAGGASRPGGAEQRFTRSAWRLLTAFEVVGTRARWIAVTVSTVCGWIGLAIWLGAMDGHFEGNEGGNGSGVWSMMLICGLVGSCQAVAVLTAPDDRRLLRRGRWAILLAVHVAVAITLVTLIAPAGSRFDAGMDVLVLGAFGWVLVPLVLAVAAGIVGLAAGLVAGAAGRFEKAAQDRSGPRNSRLRLVSSGIALLGLAGALVFWAAAVPTFDASGGGGRGAGIAIMVLLFLQAVHVLQGPSGWLFTVDRIGYLVSVAAALQWVAVTVVSRAGRGRTSADAA